VKLVGPFGEQALETVLDSEDLPSQGEGGASGGPDDRVEAGTVAASGEKGQTEGLPGAARLRAHGWVAFLERSTAF
jgi:hypothetical protein